ncbi:MAG: PilZ domain-containing protein, partial [Deltaproteobacteria bacterium]|nr:PilZ domain-containing protein [Deltaproteobacteria bacterium]
GITAQLIQNSVIFKGVLKDFSTDSFHVKISLEPPQTSQWINPETNVEVILSNENEIMYTGKCSIREKAVLAKDIILLLMPESKAVQRFRQKKFRSKRIHTLPSPNIIFYHPLTGKLFDIKAADVSGLGFAIEVESSKASFLPGMIFPEMEMNFANSFRFQFKAQVLYKTEGDAENIKSNEKVRYGLAFLDISSKDHLKLLAHLYQSNENNVYISNKVDLKLLWKFFFDSNFIYPEKYKFLQSNKNEIKQTYEKLYSQESEIARHFTYQENENIASHLAMVRFYENTWLIHHHASNRTVPFRAGLSVLNQIGLYSNDSYNLYSNHMNYLLCYFRPENKFPNRVFGGAARSINDNKKCCLELFAYFHFNNSDYKSMNTHWSWGLTETDGDDLEELNAFYTKKSTGMMLKAFDLEDATNGKDIYKAFEKSGLKRNRFLFSVKIDQKLKAILMVNVANVGLNLSDLTNATTIIVVDEEGLSIDIIKTALSLLTAKLNLVNIPVLIYPSIFAENSSIDKEREYCLWILDTQYGDSYFKYVNRLTRLI